MCKNRQGKVDVPALMATWCQQVKTIKPFDTFVTTQGVQIPGMPIEHRHQELVVKEVATDGAIMANLYRLVDGERVFEQMAQFAPDGLKQMVHLGLFIPQEFFYQFTQQTAELEEPMPSMMS